MAKTPKIWVFEYKGEIHEHSIGLLPLSQLVGTSLSAENSLDVLENLFCDIEVSIMNARFAYMDKTNVDIRERVN